MFKKKQPKCFQKLPQKVAKAVLPGIDVFHLSPKKLLFEDTLSPKTLKNWPIWSHWSLHTKFQK